LPETEFPVKLIALKSNVSAFAFTFFVFYVTPRVDLYPISPCRNHGRPII